MLDFWRKEMNRALKLKDLVYRHKPSICYERASILTESFRETDGFPILLRRAEAFAAILKKMSIYILPGELIVGNQASKPQSAPIFPEYDVDFIVKEIDQLPARTVDPFQVDESTKIALREITAYWRGKTHHDQARTLLKCVLPKQILKAYNFESKNLNQVFSNASHMTTGDGHLVPGYERVLHDGLLGITRQGKSEIERLNLRSVNDQKKKVFLDAVIIACNAVIGFANRYALKAKILASKETNLSLREELLAVAKNCSWVPGHPPRTFWEALQSCWLTHLAIQIESNGHSISFGRFDQYLYPFYKKDIDSGVLTREKALELLECFWVKCCELNKVREWAFTQFMSGYCMFQTLTLGGLTADGQDAVNDFSYLCLEATARMKTLQPTTVVRINTKTPDAFMVSACKTLLQHGGGLPAFFNDEVAIPALTSIGVALEDARNWSIMGCCEEQVGGKFLPATGGTCHINLLKILEIVLNGGMNPWTKERLLPQQGNLLTFNTYDEIWEAFKAQVKFYCSMVPIFDAVTAQTYQELTPTPFLSSLIDGRILFSEDVSAGGGPNYNNQLCLFYGLVNAANSLAALRKLVFDRKILSPADLKNALEGNFEGIEGETIRQMLLNQAPKFGNDDDAVDTIAREIGNLIVTEIQHYKPMRGGVYGPTTLSISGNVPQGIVVGATPDGRKAGQPLADNNSPTAGTDVKGPTAAILSVAKLDHERFCNGTVFNLKFHPSVFRGGDDRIRKFISLIRTFFDLKGYQVQFNIVSAETLRDAQKNPEKYPNLMVKVAGYSALFSTLDKRLQDQIIERTTHGLP
jgi:formate C-acetyltransferase